MKMMESLPTLTLRILTMLRLWMQRAVTRSAAYGMRPWVAFEWTSAVPARLAALARLTLGQRISGTFNVTSPF